jgi:lichenan operon transcriptional antiterminator
MIEQNATFHEKLTCIIFSTDYYTIGKKLLKKVSGIFSQDLFIQDLLTNMENINNINPNIDLIISTYPIKNTNIPCVVVGPLLSDSNVTEIFSKIKQVKQQKSKKHTLSKIELFLKKDLCFFGRDFKTSENVIEEICNYMIEKRYVVDSFKEGIYEHENVAPSSYGNIAIAHTFTNSDLSSVIAMAINPTPISWGDNEVNIAFIISLNKKDNKLFKDIFKFMINTIISDNALSLILKTTNYKELMDIFKHYI